MRIGLFCAAAVLGTAMLAQAPSPRLTTVTPTEGKADAEYVTAGENLDKKNVADLYLTDGKNDLKVQITEQTDKEIKFKPPASVKPGRYSLMLLTSDRARYLEQPVKVTIQ
jgi:hypothetical protein